MFIVQDVSKPNESGVRQPTFIHAEWRYENNRHNWERAMSFIPNWGHVWIRVVDDNYIKVEFGV